MTVVVLSVVHDVEGRRRVLQALEAFDAVCERQSDATRALWDTRRKLESALRKVSAEIAAVEKTFEAHYAVIEGYPDINSPYRMHDDHLGCHRCAISDLPLRHDDETVEWGDGEALACLAEQAGEPEAAP